MPLIRPHNNRPTDALLANLSPICCPQPYHTGSQANALGWLQSNNSDRDAIRFLDELDRDTRQIGQTGQTGQLPADALALSDSEATAHATDNPAVAFHNAQPLTAKSAALYQKGISRLIQRLSDSANGPLKDQARKLLAEINETIGGEHLLAPEEWAKRVIASPAAETRLAALIRDPANAAVLGIADRFGQYTLSRCTRPGADNGQATEAFQTFLQAFADMQTNWKPGSDQATAPQDEAAEKTRALATLLVKATGHAQATKFSNTVLASVAQTGADRAVAIVIKSGQGRLLLQGKTGKATAPVLVMKEAPVKLFDTAEQGVTAKVDSLALRQDPPVESSDLRDAFYRILQAQLEKPGDRPLQFPGELFEKLALGDQAHRQVPRQGTGGSTGNQSVNPRLLDTEHMLLSMLADFDQWRRAQSPENAPRLQVGFFTHLPPCSSCDLGIYNTLFVDEFDFMERLTIFDGEGKIGRPARKADPECDTKTSTELTKSPQKSALHAARDA